jgi:hypothetical protein
MATDLTSSTRSQAEPAERVRAIVESKENFVWAIMMDALCDIFGIGTLGSRIAEDITKSLLDERVICYPSPLPSRQGESAILMLKGSRFARGFHTD